MSNSFATPWTVARQAPLSMGSPRQEYWTGLPFPSPGNLPDPGIETVFPVSPALQVICLLLSHWGSPKISYTSIKYIKKKKNILAEDNDRWCIIQ